MFFFFHMFTFTMLTFHVLIRCFWSCLCCRFSFRFWSTLWFWLWCYVFLARILWINCLNFFMRCCTFFSRIWSSSCLYSTCLWSFSFRLRSSFWFWSRLSFRCFWNWSFWWCFTWSCVLLCWTWSTSYLSLTCTQIYLLRGVFLLNTIWIIFFLDFFLHWFIFLTGFWFIEVWCLLAFRIRGLNTT